MRRLAGFVFVVVVLVVLGSFGLRAILPSLAVAALRSEGFEAGTMAVSVDARPALQLYLGRAERLTLTASQVHYRSFTAQQLTVVAGPVDLFAPSTIALSGTATGAAVGDLPLGQLELAGRCPTIGFVARLPADQVRSIVAAPLGLPASTVGLAPPNGLTVTVAGATARGTLAVAPGGGGLILTVPILGRSVEVYQLPADAPVRLTAVSVSASDLELHGSLLVACL